MASFGDEASALDGGLRRAAEVLDARAGAVVIGDAAVAACGEGGCEAINRQFAAVAAGRAAHVDAPGAGPWRALAVPLEAPAGGCLVLARPRDFSADEVDLAGGMAQVLSRSVQALRTLDAERALRRAHEERGRLLERLTRIQRSISHRAPLQEVLDAITAGANELLGDSVAAIRLIDPHDPGQGVLVSHRGIPPRLLDALRRSPLGEGAGGRAIAEDRLVIIDDYERAPGALPVFARDHLQIAMAAPVRENDRVAGSLTVASYQPGRTYSLAEQEALLAFAEHASLALSDAKTVEAMREAQHAKDLFLAMVSHELKTPLTVIMGTLRTLQVRHDALTPERRTDMLVAAYERGRDLERLIDRLLQGTRAELATSRQEAWLPDLLAESARGFERARQIAWGEIPAVTVVVDAAAVRAVLGTLLENAVAHSPAGTEVGIAAAVDERDLRVTVRNVGRLPAGADPAELFQPFRRGAGARSKGVGLGLFIAARLATSMGGRIDSAADDETVTFTLRVPRREGPARHRVRSGA